MQTITIEIAESIRASADNSLVCVISDAATGVKICGFTWHGGESADGSIIGNPVANIGADDYTVTVDTAPNFDYVVVVGSDS